MPISDTEHSSVILSQKIVKSWKVVSKNAKPSWSQKGIHTHRKESITFTRSHWCGGYEYIIKYKMTDCKPEQDRFKFYISRNFTQILS